jgi:1-acyl-sn-glycerol-3-phosphate acyltransferase
VLSFYPSLFEAAVATGAPVYPSAIGYELTDGCERDLCYYGDISFGPHLFKALGFHGLHAKVVFAAQAMHYPDRKSAAKESREQVIAHRRVLASHSVEADCSLNPA